MIKMRQRKIVVLEFKQNESDKIIEYITQNMYFIGTHCLAFDFKIDGKLRKFLQDKNLSYFYVKNSNIFKDSKSEIRKNETNIESNLALKDTAESKGLDSNITTQTTMTKKIKISLDSENNAIITSVIESNITESNITESAFRESVESKREDSIVSPQDSINLDSIKLQNSQDFIPQKDSKNLAISQSQIQADSNIHNNLGSNVSQNNLINLTFNRSVRNGEVLDLNANAIFLKNINAGAVIKTKGNLQIFAKCSGNIESSGDFIVLKSFNGGKISLQNINLEGKMLDKLKDSNLKILSVENGEIKID